MGNFRSDDEYGIILLKPDGIERGIRELLLAAMANEGLEIATFKRVRLKYEDVVRHIRTNFDVDQYADYMSASEVEVFLVRGQCAIARLIDIKQRIRGMFGFSSKNMKNLLHSPDCGNEYYEHFKFLFPELDVVRYGQYADLNVKTTGSDKDVLNALRFLETSSSLSWAGVLFDYGTHSSVLKRYAEEPSNRIKVLIGLVKTCSFKGEMLQFIAYLPPVYTSTIADMPGADDSAEAYIRWIKSKGGLCVLDYRPFATDSEQLITRLKQAGIDGVVVYDPRYTQEEVARLEVISEDDLGLLLTGGSNGHATPGELAIDKTTFKKFAARMGMDLGKERRDE